MQDTQNLNADSEVKKPEPAVTKTVAPAKSVAKPSAKAATKPVAPVVKKATPKPAIKVGAKVEPKVIVKTTPKSAMLPAAKEPKVAKNKKMKLVRDSIAIPKDEYSVLADLKLRAAKLACEAKKTEIIRAGIKALAAMSDKEFLAVVRSVPNLKTGRPVKN